MEKNIFHAAAYALMVALSAFYFFRRKKVAPSDLTQSNPKNTIFAFDLHRVVFKTDVLKLIGLMFKYILPHLPLSIILNPYMWYRIRHVIKGGLSSEVIFDNLIKEDHRFIYFKTFVDQVMTAQYLNQKTVDIVRALKKKGYTIYILSDIWGSTLARLYHLFPVLNELFDGYYIPAESHGAAKPSAAFYQGFRQTLDEHGYKNKQVILVDDRKKNVIGAQNAGLKSFEYTSAQQLENLLKANKILE